MAILVGAVVDNPPAARKRPGATPSMRRPSRGSNWQIFDAAETNDGNKRHWGNADGLSAVWANNPNVRRTLRNRSRYEQANSGYLRGACRTATSDVIGRRGPRHRFGFDDAETNRFLDFEFARWMKAICLRRKLKTFIRAKKGDGEGILIKTSNPAVATPVKLDYKGIEAEQLSTPLAAYGLTGDVKDRYGLIALYATDGIIFDEHGNPTEYHVLRYHPGDSFQWDPVAFDRLDAEQVIHWFDADRPGQVRGIPETATALPSCAMLRRFTLASLQAAEIQADFAGVLQTGGTGTGDDEDEVEIPGIEIERGYIPTLPAGYTLNGFDPTHPTATYAEFKREILAEQGRGMGLPYNVMAADSSKHNYSSARLDTQEYQDDVADERSDLEEVVLNRIRLAWLREAILIPGYITLPLRMGGRDFNIAVDADPPGEWFFSGFGYIDPVKEVTAVAMRLKAGLTTLKAECARNGDDWREIIDQLAIEKEYCLERGIALEFLIPLLTVDEAPPPPAAPDKKPAPNRIARLLAKEEAA